ncbi:MAG TPA: hypothetical protein VI911_11440 [Patescibacteria group bacterium]|nr:hypothetical protein [Patescibacteria group bacterium]
MERVRKVSEEQLSKMSEEQLQLIEEKLGGRIRELIDSTVTEANKLLDIYGLKVRMQFLIEEK